MRLYSRALSDGEVSALAGSSTMHFVGKHYEKNVTANEVTTYYHLGGKLVAMRKGTALEYVHQEHLGGTAMTTDTAGAKKGETKYLPFGGTRSGVLLSTDVKFTGQPLDGGTGLYFYGARMYDANIGRFISADPIVPGTVSSQALNRYSYVLNNPTKYIDPSGLWHEDAAYRTIADKVRDDPVSVTQEEWAQLNQIQLEDRIWGEAQEYISYWNETQNEKIAPLQQSAAAAKALRGAQDWRHVGYSSFVVLEIKVGSTIMAPDGSTIKIVKISDQDIEIERTYPNGSSASAKVESASWIILGLDLTLSERLSRVPDVRALRVDILVHIGKHMQQWEALGVLFIPLWVMGGPFGIGPIEGPAYATFQREYIVFK